AERLQGVVAAGVDPAVGTEAIEDERGATAGHGLEDAAAVAHDDVGSTELVGGVLGGAAGRTSEADDLDPPPLALLDERLVPALRCVVAEEEQAARDRPWRGPGPEALEVDRLGEPDHR